MYTWKAICESMPLNVADLGRVSSDLFVDRLNSWSERGRELRNANQDDNVEKHWNEIKDMGGYRENRNDGRLWNPRWHSCNCSPLSLLPHWLSLPSFIVLLPRYVVHGQANTRIPPHLTIVKTIPSRIFCFRLSAFT